MVKSFEILVLLHLSIKDLINEQNQMDGSEMSYFEILIRFFFFFFNANFANFGARVTMSIQPHTGDYHRVY